MQSWDPVIRDPRIAIPSLQSLKLYWLHKYHMTWSNNVDFGGVEHISGFLFAVTYKSVPIQSFAYKQHNTNIN